MSTGLSVTPTAYIARLDHNTSMPLFYAQTAGVALIIAALICAATGVIVAISSAVRLRRVRKELREDLADDYGYRIDLLRAEVVASYAALGNIHQHRTVAGQYADEARAVTLDAEREQQHARLRAAERAILRANRHRNRVVARADRIADADAMSTDFGALSRHS
jgi:hypothetical protein